MCLIIRVATDIPAGSAARSAALYGAVPLGREPTQVGRGAGPPLQVCGEERVGLGQHQCVRAALPPGHVCDGELGAVDPGVHMVPALLSERPLEGASARVSQEPAQDKAQLTGAAVGGQFDRPVVVGAKRSV
jgi:hypothetical protein